MLQAACPLHRRCPLIAAFPPHRGRESIQLGRDSHLHHWRLHEFLPILEDVSAGVGITLRT